MRNDAYRDPAAVEALEQIRVVARARHKRESDNARKSGRDYPLLPYECSWAYELEFARSWPENELTRTPPAPMPLVQFLLRPPSWDHPPRP